jgi:two-component system chemotaxis response regulator CheY
LPERQRRFLVHRIMKLLIIDDSSFSRRKLREAILKEQPDVELIEASEGEEALAKIEAESPDACVTDLLMPKMDGMAFLRAVKERSLPVKVAVFSADIQESRKAECRELGAVTFLEKPLTPAKIVQLLASLTP